MDPLTSAWTAIGKGFDFGIEFLKYLSTPEGQKAAAMVTADAETFRKALKDAGDAVGGFFNGIKLPPA